MNPQNFKPGQGEEVVETTKKLSPRSAARAAALQALYQYYLNKEASELIVKQFIESGRLKGAEVSLFQALVSGVSDEAEALDALYEPFLDRSVAMIDPIEKNIMRIAVYELKYSMAIPYRAVINEAVELTKRFGADDGHKYVNGILDKVSKDLRSMEINANL